MILIGIGNVIYVEFPQHRTKKQVKNLTEKAGRLHKASFENKQKQNFAKIRLELQQATN